jgi:putative phosphoribosyl transferase
MENTGPKVEEHLVHVVAGPVTLEGNLSLPEKARVVVLFAHGSGSSRHSPRNRHVARMLNEANLATLLIDLLTPAEEIIDLRTAHLRFDIGLLAERLVAATDWLTQYPYTRGEDAPIWLGQPWRACKHPRCSSSAEMTTQLSS